MKKFSICLVLLLGVFCPLMTMAQTDKTNTRQALYGALDKIGNSLKEAPLGKRAIAVFPLDKHHDLIAGKLQIMLSRAGFISVNAKNDPMWSSIIKEIAWDENKNDILDKKTIDAFGKLKSAQLLLRCRVLELETHKDFVRAEIDLQFIEISTNQIIWGIPSSFTFYPGKDVQGIIELDEGLKKLLESNFALAAKSISTPANAAKLDKIKTVAVIPLAGDIDSYVTGLATKMLSNNRMFPQNQHIPSLSSLRTFARDGQLQSDAIFYGAIRDLRRTQAVSGPSGDHIVTSYTIFADIQMFIEDAKTGNILWVEHIPLSQVISSKREMTAEEKIAKTTNAAAVRQKELELTARIRQMELEASTKLRQMELQSQATLRQLEMEHAAKLRKQKLDAAPDAVKEDLADNWKSYAMTVVKIIGILLGLGILLAIIVIAAKSLFGYTNLR